MDATIKFWTPLFFLAAGTAFADQNLSFHGYFRTTLGLSEGTVQPAFQAPGANSKYRLGNEPDTTVELAWDYRYAENSPAAKSKSYIQGFFMLSGYQAEGNSSKLGVPDASQFYVKFAQYLGAYDLWVGRRYYQRMDIHMNDHFWLNVGQGSHVGAGMENLELGSSRLDVALFNYEDPDVPSQITPATTGTLHSRLLDVRWREIPLADAFHLNTWLAYAQRPKDELLGYRAEDGGGAAVWLDIKGQSSTDTLLAIHRRGLALVQGDFNGRPIRETQAQAYDLNKATMLEINNNFIVNTDNYSLEWALLHRQEQTGRDGLKGDKLTWNSTGVRPILYFTETTNAALEIGYDHVNNEITDLEGSVFKQTLALQLSKEKGFYARPTLRFFVTNANWSSDFKGLTGGSVYQDQTHGWSTGFQTEVWW